MKKLYITPLALLLSFFVSCEEKSQVLEQETYIQETTIGGFYTDLSSAPAVYYTVASSSKQLSFNNVADDISFQLDQEQKLALKIALSDFLNNQLFNENIQLPTDVYEISSQTKLSSMNSSLIHTTTQKSDQNIDTLFLQFSDSEAGVISQTVYIDKATAQQLLGIL